MRRSRPLEGIGATHIISLESSRRPPFSECEPGGRCRVWSNVLDMREKCQPVPCQPMEPIGFTVTMLTPDAVTKFYEHHESVFDEITECGDSDCPCASMTGQQ